MTTDLRLSDCVLAIMSCSGCKALHGPDSDLCKDGQLGCPGEVPQTSFRVCRPQMMGLEQTLTLACIFAFPMTGSACTCMHAGTRLQRMVDVCLSAKPADTPSASAALTGEQHGSSGRCIS